MAGWFYNLGRAAGRGLKKGKWMFESVTGAEEDIVRAEYEIGRELAAQTQQQMGVDADPKVRTLLDEIGPRLVKRVSNKARRFEFWCVPAETPNAFALPGGFIYINRPLIDLCEWQPNELAFVLGHEMAHVIRKHAADRMLHSSAVGTAAKVVPIGRGVVGGMIKSAGIKAIHSAYSQANEFEADALGAKLASAAGYDPMGGPDMLRRLLRRQEAGDVDWLSEYFSSHPPLGERIESLLRAIRPRTRSGSS